MSLTKVRPQQKFPLTINGAGKNKMEYKNRGKRKEDKTAQTLKEMRFVKRSREMYPEFERGHIIP
jgi:hypothetical protein